MSSGRSDEDIGKIRVQRSGCTVNRACRGGNAALPLLVLVDVHLHDDASDSYDTRKPMIIYLVHGGFERR